MGLTSDAILVNLVTGLYEDLTAPFVEFLVISPRRIIGGALLSDQPNFYFPLIFFPLFFKSQKHSTKSENKLCLLLQLAVNFNLTL